MASATEHGRSNGPNTILLAGVSLAAMTLAGAAIARDQVVVTASPLGRTALEVAAPVTVVERDEIIQEGGGNIGDILDSLPGVSASSFARGASRPIIRGLDNARIRVQENGIGAQDVSVESEDHGIPIDPLATQRIEVIRGPAVLRYGSEAIGGVVSAQNNRIPRALPEGGIDGEVVGSYSSVDNGFEGGLLLDAGVSRFAGHVDAFYRDSDEYEIPESPGEQANTQAEAQGVSVGGSLLFDNGFLGLSVAHFNSEYGIPGGEAVDKLLSIDLEQTRVNLATEFSDLGTFIDTLRVDAGYSGYTHDEIEGAAGGAVGSTFDNEEWETRAEIVHARIGGFEGAIGFQIRDRALEAAGEGGELIAPSEYQAIAAFIFEEVSLGERLRLQLGGRVEQVSAEGLGVSPPTFEGVTLPGAELGDDFGADVNPDFTPVSVSAALVYDLAEDTALGATLQYVERAPGLLELYAKGPHEATETFEIGDPDLDIESAISAEVTLKRTEGPFTVDGALFYTAFQDFIFKSETGFVCGEDFDTCGVEGDPGVEDELTQVAYAQQDADFYGFELSGTWDAAELAGGILGFDGQIDYVRAEFDNGGNVPRIPPLRFGGGVYYERGGLSARLGALRVGEQDEVATNESGTDGYTDVRARVSYAFGLPNAWSQAELGLVGSNLLDAEARNHVSFKKEDVLLPGASVRAYLRLTY